jgi:N-acetylneuraminic acid mutarotase
VALCSFKNKYLFAFGGRVDQKTILDTIEVYDIQRNVWQEIKAPLADKTKWVPGYMSLAHQINDNEIMIFGGKSAITFQIFNGCFVFDVEKMVVKERGCLINPCSFMNTPLVFEGCLYAFGNDIYIHKYHIPDQKWSCIPKIIS